MTWIATTPIDRSDHTDTGVFREDTVEYWFADSQDHPGEMLYVLINKSFTKDLPHSIESLEELDSLPGVRQAVHVPRRGLRRHEWKRLPIRPMEPTAEPTT